MEIDILIYMGGLALLDTLSPTIIGVTLYLVLTDNKNLTTRLLAYLFTVALLYFSLGILMMFGLNYIIEAFTNIFQNKIFSWVIFIIGMILFISSFLVPANKKSNIPKPKSQSTLSIIIIGFITFIIEAGTALPYYAAIGLLTSIDIPFYQWIPIIATYNIIMIFPALLIFLGYRLFGKSINHILVKIRNKISKSSNSVLSWVMCIVGVILIFYTIDYL
ncbi:GAP family protein [Cytobacillus gottheilii]|uniref:GAP family protein n=1 Tax=Cytobacillus gottheilii TaxID=859144 RepID=UPI000836F4B2|nr:GAP family protein [Cytobacillus gottheilii]